MRDSLAAVLHTCVLNRLMTNTDHPPAYTSIRRLIDMYYHVLVKGSIDDDGEFLFVLELSRIETYLLIIEQDPAKAHTPDVGTLDGLIDLLSICSLGKLLNVVDRRTYGETDLKMTSYQYRDWVKHDATPLPPRDRLANQYTRGQCAELLLWVDSNYQIVTASEDGTEEVLSIREFEKNCFERHVQLLQCYKHFADEDDFVHDIHFNSETLEIQLATLRAKYSLVPWAKLKGSLAWIPSVDRRIYPPLGGMQVKKSRAQMVSGELPSFKALLTAGMTDRDRMFEEFRLESLKSEPIIGV